VHGAQGTARIDVRSSLCNETLMPETRLQTWVQRVRPASAAVRSCSARTTWIDCRCVYQLELVYKLARATLHLPLLTGQLYDRQKEVGCQLRSRPHLDSPYLWAPDLGF